MIPDEESSPLVGRSSQQPSQLDLANTPSECWWRGSSSNPGENSTVSRLLPSLIAAGIGFALYFAVFHLFRQFSDQAAVWWTWVSVVLALHTLACLTMSCFVDPGKVPQMWKNWDGTEDTRPDIPEYGIVSQIWMDTTFRYMTEATVNPAFPTIKTHTGGYNAEESLHGGGLMFMADANDDKALKDLNMDVEWTPLTRTEEPQLTQRRSPQPMAALVPALAPAPAPAGTEVGISEVKTSSHITGTEKGAGSQTSDSKEAESEETPLDDADQMMENYLSKLPYAIRSKIVTHKPYKALSLPPENKTPSTTHADIPDAAGRAISIEATEDGNLQQPDTSSSNPLLDRISPNLITKCTKGGCHHYKPPRCHHCSKCQRCILKMDHHCFFLNRCIGLHNYKFFFQFLLSLHLSSLFYVSLLLYCFIMFARPEIFSTDGLAYVVLLPLGLFAVIFTASLIHYNVPLLLGNITQIEHMYEPRISKQRYTKGSKVKNFQLVFGTKVWQWILPLKI